MTTAPHITDAERDAHARAISEQLRRSTRRLPPATKRRAQRLEPTPLPIDKHPGRWGNLAAPEMLSEEAWHLRDWRERHPDVTTERIADVAGVGRNYVVAIGCGTPFTEHQLLAVHAALLEIELELAETAERFAAFDRLVAVATSFGRRYVSPKWSEGCEVGVVCGRCVARDGKWHGEPLALEAKRCERCKARITYERRPANITRTFPVVSQGRPTGLGCRANGKRRDKAMLESQAETEDTDA